ncbi:PREDICTED: cell division cycle-associated protein 7-like [Nicrophorus vespilloides]|uniref:Cell division cycle-associated protein 7-like n=1 Tax=Nicrophorus vespilloides TaxID=110193 RepID=A0ABM1MY72_NICVS|nr:PREDICTED: cell division cycle-associated protein 7-like [Nicrophorus vespilloides]
MYSFSDDEELTDIEKTRLENMKEIDKFVAAAFGSSGLTENLTYLKATQRRIPRQRKNVRKPLSINVAKLTAAPQVKRSARLANKKPELFYKESAEGIEETLPRKSILSSSEEEFEDDEPTFFVPKKRRTIVTKFAPVPCVAVENITQDYLNRIAYKGYNKTYSEQGTSCHQCRQKTKDSKTYCRSGKCTGVRGQFCGTCLMNRYGEDARDALKNPNWSCPPCRDICNCSICRNRQGKRPTGILFPMAQAHGHKSVKDFLATLSHEKKIEKIKAKSAETIVKVDEKSKVKKDFNIIGFDKAGYAVSTDRDVPYDAAVLGFVKDKAVCRLDSYLKI